MAPTSRKRRRPPGRPPEAVVPDQTPPDGPEPDDEPDAPSLTGAADAPEASEALDPAAPRRSRNELRDEQARAALTPLAPGERPAALIVAVAVAGLLAIGVVIGATTVHNLTRHGGSAPGGAVLASILVIAAWGMWHRRYWAVLGFEALLAFQMVVTSLALLVAETVEAAVLCVASIGLSGWLFWKLIRVMGRLSVSAPRSAPGDR
jgi:hypothetical protein